jgi:hypothetical protein
MASGGEIGLHERKYLIAHLRGENKRRPGMRRTLAQREADEKVAQELIWIIISLAMQPQLKRRNIVFNSKGDVTVKDDPKVRPSLYRAQQIYLERYPEMNKETLRTICRRMGLSGKIWGV